MSQVPRRARVRAFAKLNLGLKVLGRRPDGFHELRTVFQTISLSDTLDIEFTPAPRTTVEVECPIDIPNNLAERAARLVLESTSAAGRVSIRLIKQIPMGSGLGGGSTDAAAVLLAVPVLAGRRVALQELLRIGSELGSDVPFFLLGGTAVGLGRGSELYPLPEPAPWRGVLASPGFHVSTPQAYAALGRELTLLPPPDILSSFQSCVWVTGAGVPVEGWPAPAENDFEEAVFRQYPQLKSLKRTLLRLGADPALMTGSGSAVFGVFRSRARLERAVRSLRKEKVFEIAPVSRARYRSQWWRSLRAHIDERTWPPQSRYER
jgi:4-diphosphocytidyl-2-C-methyl-D-erythritol kinase